jgi:hypothetical protein
MTAERGGQSSTAGRALRRVAGIIIPLVMSLCALGAIGAPAAHADVDTTFQNQETGGCLTWLRERYSFVHVQVCGADARNQVWSVHRWRDGTIEIRSLVDGQCLDDSDAFGTRMFGCNATPFQSWYPHTWNDGTIQLKNQATGRCLDYSHAYLLRTYTCNASTFQSWYGAY